MTLAEFLLARLAEDEVLALSAQEMEIGNVPRSHPWAVFGPARVLADVEAKRLIISMLDTSGEDYYVGGLSIGILDALAEPYRDHPDFENTELG